ncbi:MAG: adenine deaminase [Gemmatales bacterium]|nr:adenine deaminase [Gemmatales bacterium]
MSEVARDSSDLARLQRRIRVALGQEPGDLLLTHAQVVNVFTRRTEMANIVVADGYIAGVGTASWSARQVVDLQGQYVLPGLIDSHMHLESTLLLPSELARLAVPHGTAATISDSHEIGNVLGVRGIELLVQASMGLPLDVYFMASSCVPATAWEDAGASIGAGEIASLLRHDRVLGLAEVMDLPAVWNGSAYMLEKILTAQRQKSVIDGHAPNVTGLSLQAYVAAGMRADHESSTVEEAREKARLGMLVQIRDGSIAHNLDTLLPRVVSGELGDRWTLVTDDILPDDLRQWGHLDYLLRRAITAGVAPEVAVRHATLVPAQHYGLSDRGAIAPSYRADLVVVDDLRRMNVRLVYHAGQLVARDGEYLGPPEVRTVPCENTIRLPPLDEGAFRLRPASATCPVIGIIPGQLITRHERRSVRLREGEWEFSPEEDVALLASIERHRASGKIGLGLVSGFGFRRHGALASSVAHDSHNIIVAGTNPSDMLVAVRALAETGGGFVAVAQGQVLARLPLPFGGLLSTERADVVCEQLRAVRQAAQSLGCPLACPFGALSFLALPVIPELKITARGVFDVVRQQWLHL